MFDLEKQERIIVIFLVLALLSGLGLAVYKSHSSKVTIRIGHFNAEKLSGGNITVK